MKKKNEEIIVDEQICPNIYFVCCMIWAVAYSTAKVNSDQLR